LPTKEGGRRKTKRKGQGTLVPIIPMAPIEGRPLPQRGAPYFKSLDGKGRRKELNPMPERGKAAISLFTSPFDLLGNKGKNGKVFGGHSFLTIRSRLRRRKGAKPLR